MTTINICNDLRYNSNSIQFNKSRQHGYKIEKVNYSVVEMCGNGLFTFLFPPIPTQSIPIPSHSQFCDYSHSHPIPVDLLLFPCSGPKYYELTSNLCVKTKSAGNSIPELCQFCFIQSRNAQTYMQQARTTGNVVAPYIISIV